MEPAHPSVGAGPSDAPVLAIPVGVPSFTAANVAPPGVGNGPAGPTATAGGQAVGGPIVAVPANSAPIGLALRSTEAPPVGPITARPRAGEAGGRDPGAGSLRIAAPADSPREATPPRGAGLITGFSPFDRASIEESVTRFLDRFKDDGTLLESQADDLPNWVLVMAAAVAVEAARRWRQRLESSGSIEPGTRRGPAFDGLS